jgi:hypothetical protein
MAFNGNNEIVQLDSYENLNKTFKTNQFITKFVIRNASDMPEEQLKYYISKIIDKAYEMTEKETGIIPNKFAILFNSPTLIDPISIPFRQRDYFTAEMIMNEIDMLEVDWLLISV